MLVGNELISYDIERTSSTPTHGEEAVLARRAPPRSVDPLQLLPGVSTATTASCAQDAAVAGPSYERTRGSPVPKLTRA